MDLYMYMYMYMDLYMYMYMYIRIHTHTQTHTYTQTHTQTHTQTQTHTHTHTHTYTDTYTYSYTYRTMFLFCIVRFCMFSMGLSVFWHMQHLMGSNAVRLFELMPSEAGVASSARVCMVGDSAQHQEICQFRSVELAGCPSDVNQMDIQR